MKIPVICVFLALFAAGCHVHEVSVRGPAAVVVVEEDSRAWDGVVWVTYHHHHHGPGCGHYYHHAEWHLYPSEHVYVHGQGYFGATIRIEGPEHDRPRQPDAPRNPDPPHQPNPPAPPAPPHPPHPPHPR